MSASPANDHSPALRSSRANGAPRAALGPNGKTTRSGNRRTASLSGPLTTNISNVVGREGRQDSGSALHDILDEAAHDLFNVRGAKSHWAGDAESQPMFSPIGPTETPPLESGEPSRLPASTPQDAWVTSTPFTGAGWPSTSTPRAVSFYDTPATRNAEEGESDDCFCYRPDDCSCQWCTTQARSPGDPYGIGEDNFKLVRSLGDAYLRGDLDAGTFVGRLKISLPERPPLLYWVREKVADEEYLRWLLWL